MKGKSNYILDMQYADSKYIYDKLNTFIQSKMSTIDPIVKISAVPPSNVLLQREGIDKIAEGISGKIYKIEEKVRRKKYDDFLFEIVADTRYGFYDPVINSLVTTNEENKERAVGWALKEYRCDLLLYFFETENNGFLFSWKKMKKVIDNELPYWFTLAEKEENNKFSIKIAKNESYNSLNVSVPMDVFLKKYREVGGSII